MVMIKESNKSLKDKNFILPLILILTGCIWILCWFYYVPKLNTWSLETKNLTWVFFVALLLPWLAIIGLTIWDFYDLNSKYSGKGKNLIQPLNIPQNSVRSFHVITIGVLFFYFLYLERVQSQIIDIPLGILIIMNAILAYYGLRSNKLMPDLFENVPDATRPTNEQLLDSVPVIRDIIQKLEEKLAETKKIIENWHKEFNDKGKELTSDLKDLSVEFGEKVNSRLNDIETILKNIPDDKNNLSNIDVIIVTIGITLLILLAPTGTGNSFFNLIMASGGGIAGGWFLRNKMNVTVFNKIKKSLNLLHEDINSVSKDMDSILKDIDNEFTKMENTINEFEQSLYNFKKQNFFDFLPTSISSMISIIFVSFFTLFALHTAQTSFSVPDEVINVIQWYVLYYFTTKV